MKLLCSFLVTCNLCRWQTDVFHGASKSTSKYPLSCFILPEEIDYWMKEGTKSKSLIITGEGGLGKTEMVKAILASLGKYFYVDSLDIVKSLLFTGHEPLLFDDV